MKFQFIVYDTKLKQNLELLNLGSALKAFFLQQREL